MKKVMSILLAAVMMLLCVSGCGGETYDAKICFPDNNHLKLSASEDEIVKAQDFVWEDGRYIRKDYKKTQIDGIDFRCMCTFNDDGTLKRLWYNSAAFEPSEDQVFQDIEKLKTHFDGIYGASSEYPGYMSDKTGYSWNITLENGAQYQLIVYTQKNMGKYSFVEVNITEPEK